MDAPPAAQGGPYVGYRESQSAYASAVPGAQYIGQWNWGAFLLCPLWLMNHRKVGLGILYIVLCVIPLVNLVTLGMIIYYGIKGNEVAVASGRFTDDAQFVAVQNAWRNWGIGVNLVSLALAVIFGLMRSSGTYY
jgi:hypothetical protein